MNYELTELVREWRREKGIDNPKTQMLKCCEEINEVVREVVRERYDTPEIKDGIGDTLVTIIVLADILNLDLDECLQMAYDTISKRKGKIVDGNFIKQEDLNA